MLGHPCAARSLRETILKMKMPKDLPTMVWRISESTPMGEWVDLRAAPRASAPRAELPDVQQGTWVRSSYDLLDGIDVDETEDTVPTDLFDELFGAPPLGSKKA
jgi:hypothetical protein